MNTNDKLTRIIRIVGREQDSLHGGVQARSCRAVGQAVEGAEGGMPGGVAGMAGDGAFEEWDGAVDVAEAAAASRAVVASAAGLSWGTATVPPAAALGCAL